MSFFSKGKPKNRAVHNGSSSSSSTVPLGQQENLKESKGKSSVALLEQAHHMAKLKSGEIFSSWIHDNGKDETDFTYDYMWQKAGTIAYRLVEKFKLKRGDRVILCYGFGLPHFLQLAEV